MNNMKTNPAYSSISLIKAAIPLPALVAIALLATHQAEAASAAWNVDSDGNWVTGSNWSPAAAPGATSGTTNTDTATFGLTLTANRTVTVDSNRNIQNITFSNTGNFGYVVHVGAIKLTNGGAILENSASGVHNNQLNSSIEIQGDGGTASFTNNAVTNVRLFMAGDISGVSTGANVTTLNLNGTQSGQPSSKLTGNLTDGAGGGKLAVVKSGASLWSIAPSAGKVTTFSGGVTLNAGTLGFENNSSTVFGTGTLTINGGTLASLFTGGGDVTFANAVTVGGNFAFTDGSATTLKVTLSGAMDLGGATRTITTSTAASNSLGFSGVISNGGLTKAGAADSTLTLSGANTYTGDTTVSSGTLILADNSQTKFLIGATGVNNQINGTGTLTLDGDFVFDLTGAGTTLGNSWNIVNVGTLGETFGATFAVQNFFSVNTTLWAKSIGGGNFYNFDETTGLLSVTAIPEPATWALLAFSLTTVMVMRRRKA